MEIIAKKVVNRRPLKQFTVKRDHNITYKEGYGMTIEGVKCQIIYITDSYVYLMECEHAFDYREYKEPLYKKSAGKDIHSSIREIFTMNMLITKFEMELDAESLKNKCEAEIKALEAIKTKGGALC